jgi:probable poly-beta-1,6-N-acetyl-D-glucosamine export protein
VPEKKKAYLDYIHNFRGTAILFIVFIHVATALPWGINLVGERIALIIFNNGTVLFVFIAGFLFYHLNNESFKYYEYLKKRFNYVILPYLIISVPAIIDKLFFDQPGEHWWLTQSFDEKTIVFKITYLILTGYHNGVLWFIPMITIIYVCTKPILFLARKPYFEFFAPAIFFIGLFLNSFGYRSNIFLSFLYFFPVFIFGIWTYKVKDILFSNWKYILTITCVTYFTIAYLEYIGVIPFDMYLTRRDTTEFIFDFNLDKLKLYLLCLLLLISFKQFFFNRNKIFETLANYSFGIFFIHLYIVIILRYVLISIFGIHSLTPFSFLMYALTVTALSILLVFGIKTVFGNRSRYLIGS